jgi:hypothetical protein
LWYYERLNPLTAAVDVLARGVRELAGLQAVEASAV